MQTLSYGELNFSVKYHLSESFTHFTYFEAISLMKTKKNWEFGVDPLNWQSFIEIGEMACSTTAWCSRKYTIDGWHIFSFLKL